MEEKSIRNRVRELIIANNTDEAIELLSKAQLSAVDKQLIVLTSQYNRVREELRLDVISRDEAERKINQINLALLDLSYKVENKGSLSSLNYQPATPSGGFNRNYLWLLLLPLIAVAVYFFSPSEEPATASGTETVTQGSSNNNHATTESPETVTGIEEDTPVSTPNTTPSNSNSDKGSSSSQPTTVTPPPPKPEPTPSGPTLADLRKDPALAAYYPFNGNTNDAVGYKNLTVNGDMSPGTYKTGAVGQALFFDGKTGSRVDGRLLLDLFSTHFSIAFWIKPDKSAGLIFGQMTTEKGSCIHCAALCNHCLGFTKEGAIFYDEYPPDSGSEKLHEDPDNNIPVNTWTHVAFVRDKTTAKVRLYLDGELAAEDFETETFKTGFGSPNRTWIGGRHRHSLVESDFFQGSLDEFYVFNRAITTEEVKLLAGDKN